MNPIGGMPSAISARVELSPEDFVMANHRVHGISVLPGVALLDLVYRVLIGRGVAPGRAELREVLFTEAITTRPGHGREVEVEISAPDAAGRRAVAVSSRWLLDGAPHGRRHEHAAATLILGPADAADAPGPDADLDLRALLARIPVTGTMEDLYRRARAEQIVHGLPMKCAGELRQGSDGVLLARLELDASAREHEDDFFLHPAKMDASTLAGFGQTAASGRDPFIPMYIERLRAPRPVGHAAYVHAPRPETLSASGEVLRSDYGIHDLDGHLLVEIVGMVCKRIRRPDLITRLIEEEDEAADVPRSAVAGATEAADAPRPAGAGAVAGATEADVVDLVRSLVAEALDEADPAAVDTRTGFYDLGLDSEVLLDLGRRLEGHVGGRLYPTLLFEYGDIRSLARHLHATYTVRTEAAATPVEVAEPVDGGDDRVVLLEPRWQQVSDRRTTTARTRRVVVIGGAPVPGFDHVAQADLDHAGEISRRGAGLDGVLLQLPVAPAADQAALVCAVASALAALPADGAVEPRLLLVRPESWDGPSAAVGGALGAMCATITTESPRLCCRVLDADRFDPAVLERELADTTTCGEVRVRGGVREQMVLAETAASPAEASADSEAVADAPAEPVLRPGGRYLITGGSGGVARALTDHLLGAAEPAGEIVLVSRSAPSALPDGGSVRFVRADVTNAAELGRALDAASVDVAGLDAVLHCAGATRDALFLNQRPPDIAEVLAPKVDGVTALDEVLTARGFRGALVLFSSTSAVLPSIGQSAYAFANGYLDRFALWRSGRADAAGRAVSINWPWWRDGGMSMPQDKLDRARRTLGTAPLPTAAAVDGMRQVLARRGAGRAVVLFGDAGRIRANLITAAPTAASTTAPPDAVPTAVPVPAPAPASAVDASGADASPADDFAVAVIGLAGQYPRARNVAELWDNLRAGLDCVTEIPADRWDSAAYFDPRKPLPGHSYSKWGGFLDGADLFDRAFFGISRREAERMDPQERLFLTTCWQAVEDAGYAPEELSGRPVGVFVGVMWNHYQLVTGDEPGHATPTAMHAAVANRVSWTLDLRGPSMAVDTACSSSLTSLHLAMESLRSRESTLALAGGVNLSLHPQKYLQLSEGQFLSTDGRCRSMGAGGDGYVPGEGVGAVLLKPLRQALDDGDHVYGVLRAGALNHTGRTAGFTVPTPAAQRAVIRAALDRAGWEPGSVGYIEAHGTGTALGDPIESESIARALAPTGGCVVGSVKSNLGHLESAAGIAGLTKVLLQLRHRRLVPSLHATEPNPELRWDPDVFRVPTVTTPWPEPAPGLPRRAGVSAFGAGGANAHVLVEEAPAGPRRTAVPDGPYVFPFSARDEQALRDTVRAHLASAEDRPERTRYLTELVARELRVSEDQIDPGESFADLGLDAAALRRLADQLPAVAHLDLDSTVASVCDTVGSLPDTAFLADVAHTLQRGRQAMRVRAAVVAGSMREYRDALRDLLAADPSVSRVPDGVAEYAEPREQARTWVEGADVDWPALPGARRIPLPTYPFRGERCWVGGWERRQAAEGAEPAGPAAAPQVPQAPLPAVPVEPSVPAEPAGPFRDTEDVSVRILEHGIAVVTMHDRTRSNMFSQELTRALIAAFADLDARDEVNVVVLTARGPAFSMGATRDALLALSQGRARFTDVPFMYEGLLRFGKPVVAAIQGHASGGGLAFGLWADIVVMSREGLYSANFTRYGFTPGMGATYILQQRLGRTLAAELFYTARGLTGRELERRGAAVRFADPQDVLADAMTVASAVAQSGPEAVRALKRDLSDRVLVELPDILARESRMHAQVLGEESARRVREHFERVQAVRPAARPSAPARSSEPAPAPSEPAPAAPAPRNRLDPATVASAVTEALGEILYLEPSEIDVHQGFTDLGLDSLGAVELARVVNARFGLVLDSVVAYDHPSVTALTAYVCGEHERMADLASTTVPALSVADAEAEAEAEAEAVAMAEDAPDHVVLVRGVLGRILGLGPEEIPLDTPFGDLGLDSLGAVELTRELGDRTGVPLDSTAVYDHPSVERLSTLLAGRRATAVTPEPPAASPITPFAVSARALAAVSGTSQGRVTLRTVAESAAPTAPGPVDPDAIAVIGMAGQFPDAPDLDAFWANLAAGRSSVREVPGARWDVESVFDPDRRAADRTYSRWAAMLDDVESFDPAAFQISPLEADSMDPQQRLFLQTAYHCLEDAGHARRGPDPRPWGVFVGCAAGDYPQLLDAAGQSSAGAHAFLGNAASVLPARIAYLMHLTGPTLAVDTACSSSLVALHLACEAIRRGDCEAALAGGVAVMTTPRMQVMTSQTGMLSPTGRSAPFDASANGIVLGEAVGAVLLKPLRRALEDGDTVHGVVLASGVNGDGRTNGLTAPSALSQERLLRQVHRRAGVDTTRDVGYVEAHGTGTHLGDPIEAKALAAVLGGARPDHAPCYLGSVKGNIGHTTTAAGMASVIKVLLALRHRSIPPSVNFTRLNPEITGDITPLQVPTKLVDWAPDQVTGRRIAAVSGFGFSGTNAHVLIGEAVGPATDGPRPAARDAQQEAVHVVPVSAVNRAALSRTADALVRQLEVQRPQLADVAFTLNAGRTHFPVRAAVVASSLDELVSGLRAVAEGRIPPAAGTAGTAESVQALGAALAEAGDPASTRSVLLRCADAYRAGVLADLDIAQRPGRRVPLPGYAFGGRRYWPRPAADQAPVPVWPAPGAALGPEHPVVDDHRVGGRRLLPAMATVALAVDAAARHGVTAPLTLRSVQWLRPVVVDSARPVELSVTGEGGDLRFRLGPEEQWCVRGRITAHDGADPDLALDVAALAGRCPDVRSADLLYAGFAASGIAYGPTYRLLASVAVGEDEVLAYLGGPARPEPDARVSVQFLDAAMQAAAALGTSGGALLPLLPFAAERIDVLGPTPARGVAHVRRDGSTYQVRVADESGQVRVVISGLTLRPLVGDTPAAESLSILQPVLRPAAVPHEADPGTGRSVVVLHTAAGALGAELAAVHRAHGDTVVVAGAADEAALLGPDGRRPDLLYVLGLGGSLADHESRAARLLLNAVRVLGTAGAAEGTTVKVVHAGAAPANHPPAPTTNRPPAPAEPPQGATLHGLARCAAAEFRRWTVGCVDVVAPDSWSPRDLARALFHEPAEEPLVVLRDGARWIRALSPVGQPGDEAAEPADVFRRGGTYLVIGGTGGVGSVLCRHLASTAGARLVLLGRSAASDERVRTLRAEIAALGGQTAYVQGDVADPGALVAAIRTAHDRFGGLNGVVHAAMNLHDRSLLRMTEADLEGVLAAKTAGVIELGEAVREQHLDVLLFFSSAIAFTEAPGQGNYAAATTFEDAYAAYLARCLPFPVRTVNWGYWGSVGAVADAGHRERLGRIGIGSIEPDESMAAVNRLVASPLGQAVVVKGTQEGLRRLGALAGEADELHSAYRSFAALDDYAAALLRARVAELSPDADPKAFLRARFARNPYGAAALDAFARVLDRADGLPAAAGEPDRLLATHPALAPHVEMLRRCVAALPDVLDGTRPPTDVLFPGGSTALVERLYRGDPISDFHHRLLAERVRRELAGLAAAGRRDATVLEVGAGTGAGSAHPIEACTLATIPVTYRYTDVSLRFLQHGEEAFGRENPFMTFEILDIAAEPEASRLASADIVITTNVLHATAGIARTLGNVAMMLRPGGLLVVNEATRVSPFVTLTFGLTPGWWKFDDADRRLPGGPLLSADQWRTSLTDAGFEVEDVSGMPDPPGEGLPQAVVAARLRAPAAPAQVADSPAGHDRIIDAPAGRDRVADAPADRDRVADHVRQVFARTLKFDPEDLDERATFDQYGVDSLVSLAVIDELAREFGELPATLLFENLTMLQVADWLLAERAARVQALLAPAPAPAPAPVPAPVPAPAPAAVPAAALPHMRQVVAPRAPEPAAQGEEPARIAVIGVEGRYPAAPDLDAFWQLLSRAGTAESDVPPERWNWRENLTASADGTEIGRRACFLSDIDGFDAGFFGILPRDAEDIDPQERLFLETCWNLLDRAGRLADDTRNRDTGVFVGTMYHSYGQLAATQWAYGSYPNAHSASWSVANRVSYLLDLNGPSFAVDSACSSSLLAVHLACESLRRGECGTAVAGGVNLILHPAHLRALGSRNMLAADGRCKVFDEAADGFVPGEGVGAVLLKPLADAERDGDEVLAVILASSTNAGGRTSGYTVPNPRAQSELIADVLDRSRIDPATVGYVEAHGTGTALGDPIELSALASALRTDGGGSAGAACAVGSVKANIGHLEGAAGIAGLTKVLLQLRHRAIAPCANLTTVNGEISGAARRLTLPTALTDWPAPPGGGPRRAGVSSFGAGGANVHLVLEEAPRQPAGAPPRGPEILLLSARDREALRDAARDLADQVAAERPDAARLAALCYSSQVGRREFPHRLSVRVRNPESVVAALRAAAAAERHEDLAAGTAPARAGLGRPALTVDADGWTAAVAWVTGTPVRWREAWTGHVVRAKLPAYPFRRVRTWQRYAGPVPGLAAATPGVAPPTLAAATPKAVLPTLAADQPLVFQRAEWAPRPRPAAASTRSEPSGPYTTLLLGTDDALRDAVAARLRSAGRPVIDLPGTASSGGSGRVDGRDWAELDRVAGQCADAGAPVRVVLCCTAEPEEALAGDRATRDALDLGLKAPFAAAAAALRSAPDVQVRVGVASYDLLGRAAAAALRTLAAEHPRLRAVTLRTNATEPAADRAAALLGEVEVCDAGVTEIALTGGQRLVRRLTAFALTPTTPTTPATSASAPAVRSGGNYLVSGGGGGLGLLFARHLVDAGAGSVTLIGRSEGTERVRAAVAELGSAATYRVCDVAVAESVAALVGELRRLHGPLHGVLHAAGVTRDGRALRKSAADFDEVLRAKALGATVLDEATREEALDFFVLFSSVVAEVPNPGQADYCAANAYLGEWAAARAELVRHGRRSGRTVAVGWPLWAEGGMSPDPSALRLLTGRAGMVPLSTRSGLSVFQAALAADAGSFVVHATAADEDGSPAVTAPPETTGAAATVDQESVERELGRIAAGFLLVPEDEVDLTADLLDAGFDSVSLTELIGQVNSLYGLDLLPTVLFECTTLSAFARHLTSNHAAEIGAVAPVVPVAPVAPPDEVVPQAVAAPRAASETEAEAEAEAEPAAAVADVPDEIAVIGIAGVLPGSPGMHEYWRHLAAGHDLVTAPPADRLELLADPELKDIEGGFLADIGRFDARAFRISPQEARAMDPQQRLFLTAARDAILDAGYAPADLAGSRTAVFAGVSTTDYDDLLHTGGVAVQAHTASGLAHSILANRVSYVLDLHGPSEAVDTACSSSLVALHRGIAALRAGECDAVLAGGVNTLLSPGLFRAFGQSGMLSPGHRCRTFDRSADGYVRGEGVGVVLLKPLAAARADGDHVYAVIAGSAVNHGGRASSLTAPNPALQAEVLYDSFRRAAIEPHTLTAIEAHGTATPLGDPVEVDAIKRATRRLYDEHGAVVPEEPVLALGSVKSNLGHLEAASGIAGLLKTVLAMQGGVLPPSLHFDEPNPHLRLAGGPLYVNTEAAPWPYVTDGHGRDVRVAGVSSFGFGGTNAHVVLRAERPDPGPSAPSGPWLVPVSAHDAAALAARAAALAGDIRDRTEPLITELAYSLQFTDRHGAVRAALIADDVSDLLKLLADLANLADLAGAGSDAAGRVLVGGGEVPETLRADAACWTDGGSIDWRRYWTHGRPGRVTLPTPVPRGATYWFDGRASLTGGTPPMAAPSDETPVETPLEPPAVAPPAARRRIRLTPLAPSPATAPREERRQPERPAVREPAVREPVTAAPSAPAPAPAPAPVPRSVSASDAALVIRDCAARLLDIAAAEFPLDASFTEFGLDSIFRMDLARELTAFYDVEVKATDLYDVDCANDLALRVAALASEASEASEESEASEASSAAEPATALVEPQPVAEPTEGPASLLARLVERVTGRALQPGDDFTAHGLTSFDMLRTVSALEREFGSLRKTLLFDHPTALSVGEHLREVHGDAAAAAGLRAAVARAATDAAAPDARAGVRLGEAAAPEPAPDPASDAASADEPLIVYKRGLDATPELKETLSSIDAVHAKEGGLAGRDIAPLAFLGTGRRAYFNFSRRGTDLLAWSYVGSEADFPVLAGEYVSYARRHGLDPNFLSMIALPEAAGVPLSATPFGAVQRLEDLQSFSMSGGRMSRLRYMVSRFERSGRVGTREYRVGSDPATDAQIVALIERWAGGKQMVNPYVPIFREELARGVLGERHRMFLTTVNGALSSAVILTGIPSENGYLLDLEFYPPDTAPGGLEYAIVHILQLLAEEGCTVFSFGASFGVRIAKSPNASEEVERGLAELHDAGIFGNGNFQFKNKFRPVNTPIFLCQPADPPHTSVADVILMIANPDVAADAPGLRTPAAPTPAATTPAVPTPATTPTVPTPVAPKPVAPKPVAPTRVETARAEPPQPAPAALDDAAAARRALLAGHGWNPLALDYEDAELDLVTDSWAEHAAPFVDRAVADLRARSRIRTPVRPREPDVPIPSWLPFPSMAVTGSGRAAEALLCRAWPGRRGAVLHNTVFPTWNLSLLENGFQPEALAALAAGDTDDTDPAADTDTDADALRSRLADPAHPVAFVCLEAGSNASGGRPLTPAALRRVREATAAAGVPLVLDATRIVGNALLMSRHEQHGRGRDAWQIVREMLELADAVTISLSKEFGLDFGGVLATSHPALAEHVAEHVAAHGPELGLNARRMVGSALLGTDRVCEAVTARLDAVQALWDELGARLERGGVRQALVGPAPGAHCVLLDVARLPAFAGLHAPVPSFLAWLFERTGLRAGPHLVPAAADGSADPRLVRLAVPLGLDAARCRAAGRALAAALTDLREPPFDLLPVDGAVAVTAAATGVFHPAEHLPEDIGTALREGERARGDNLAVLTERAPSTRRHLVSAAAGKIEFFTAGSGPTLLLMHPFNIGAGVFTEQFAALAGEFQVVAVHNPGVGDTTAAADLSLAGLAELNRLALKEAGIDGPVHLAGVSFGGLVAQTFALNFPAEVLSLTLIGSSYKVGNRAGEVNRLGTVADEDFDRIIANDPTGELARQRESCRQLLLRSESMDPKIGLSYLDVFAQQPTLMASLPSISVPTLVLHGRLDTVVPLKAAHLLHGAIPDVRFVELPGAGHFPFVTHVDEVHRALVPFLREHARRADAAEVSR